MKYDHPKPTTLNDKIIDAAFQHVANNYVLRQLKAGKSWSDAFGIGGASHPVRWMGDSKGITIERTRLITIAEIKNRANQWFKKDNLGEQLNLF